MVKGKSRAHTGEDNQTKWVGVRPVNPPETIPTEEQTPLTSIQVEPKAGAADLKITLDGEVVHVIVDSG